jgi:hypothetical protein
MKTVLASRRAQSLVRFSAFLIVVALIAGMAGCDIGAKYDLTMVAVPAGNGTALDLTNASPYGAGTEVSIKAVADPGYRFIRWTATAGILADADAPETTFTMPAQKVTVTANFAPFAGGSGAATDRYQIATWHDLQEVRNYLTRNFILMNDLDSSTAGYEELVGPTANGEQGWQPIGSRDAPFAGRFDGGGYEISDLFINRPDENDVGLFGALAEYAFIENIGVMDATVIGQRGVGGVAGFNDGTVTGSYSSGDVTGRSRVGGLVGDNEGSVINAYFVGIVTGYWGDIGGLVGWNHGHATVYNSYSGGDVTGDSEVGGLVGENWGTVSNAHSISSVTGDAVIGGLAGYNGQGIIKNSYFTGRVTGYMGIGGLVGSAHWDSTIRNSHYDYNEVLINGESIITTGALCSQDFEEWLTNDRFLDVNERLSQEDDYYAINDVSDFKQLLAFGQNAFLKFRLNNDLDLATEPNFYIPYLAGEFEGNGHVISNFSFNLDFISHVGLFGQLAYGGRVANLAVENVNIIAAFCVGGVVALNQGTMNNSYSTGSVTGNTAVGGLAGSNGDSGTVTNSYSAGSASGYWCVGGLLGHNIRGTVSSSYSTAGVTADSEAGGLVGWNDGDVSNCYSTGTVVGNWSVGGLVALNDGDVSNSFWDIETSGQATSDGGTGKTTVQLQDITTFSGAGWDIVAVADPGTRNPSYIWNIVDAVTYPFLSWQPVS